MPPTSCPRPRGHCPVCTASIAAVNAVFTLLVDATFTTAEQIALGDIVAAAMLDQ